MAVMGRVATPARAQVVGFSEFFAREHIRLGRAIYLLTGNGEEAEELVQEALARAYERWDRVSRMDEPAGYVYRIAANLLRRKRRIRAWLPLLGERPGPGADPIDAAESRMDLLAALATLPSDQRETVILVEMFGYDAETAARVFGIKAVSVRVRLHRARRRLREVLGGDDA